MRPEDIDRSRSGINRIPRVYRASWRTQVAQPPRLWCHNLYIVPPCSQMSRGDLIVVNQHAERSSGETLGCVDTSGCDRRPRTATDTSNVGKIIGRKVHGVNRLLGSLRQRVRRCILLVRRWKCCLLFFISGESSVSCVLESGESSKSRVDFLFCNWSYLKCLFVFFWNIM